jgi:hypothetical protein
MERIIHCETTAATPLTVTGHMGYSEIARRAKIELNDCIGSKGVH